MAASRQRPEPAVDRGLYVLGVITAAVLCGVLIYDGSIGPWVPFGLFVLVLVPLFRLVAGIDAVPSLSRAGTGLAVLGFGGVAIVLDWNPWLVWLGGTLVLVPLAARATRRVRDASVEPDGTD